MNILKVDIYFTAFGFVHQEGKIKMKATYTFSKYYSYKIV